jgi:hypothetical protein
LNQLKCVPGTTEKYRRLFLRRTRNLSTNESFGVFSQIQPPVEKHPLLVGSWSKFKKNCWPKMVSVGEIGVMFVE